MSEKKIRPPKINDQAMPKSILEQTPWLWSLLILGLAGLLSCVSFDTSPANTNWLGAIGHGLGYASRFMLGICAVPIYCWLSLIAFKGLSKCAPRADLNKRVLPVVICFICAGLLLNLFAELKPTIAQRVAGWSHVQKISSNKRLGPAQTRYNLGGVPLYFIYCDIPLVNLRHLLSDTGLSILASFGLLGCAWYRHHTKVAITASEKALQTSMGPKPAFVVNETAQLNMLKELRLSKSSSPSAQPIQDTTHKLEQKSTAIEPKPFDSKAQTKTDRGDKEKAGDKALPSALTLLKKAKSKLGLEEQSSYVIPSLELLTPGKSYDLKKVDTEIGQQSRLLEETLLSFGIEGKVGQVHIGPRILSFEVHPAIGVKVQRIKALENDIALNLQANSLRIIAPIPGKAAVGIEVPTKFPQEVNFRQMVTQYQSQPTRYAIPIILGKTVSGEDVHFDLAKMPHMIIAGATGSGKSVCVNTIIMSILLHASADDIRLLMIDPKKVELTPYGKLPHMIAPVITEPHHAAEALRWLVVEMERRYEILKRMGLRHIEAFNTRERDEAFESSLGIEIPIKLPYIVGIIDELADLMMTSPSDIETPIARIAQMARAIGIHLILATQRPSREVITGLIKANFPARIAFKVSSRVNSQIILDEVGAECLLGNGDMLFLHPTKGSLMRAQGAFIRDEDINRVIETIEMQSGPNYLLKPDLLAETSLICSSAKSEDELFESAKKLVIETGTASTTFLQRKLRIGYARAASLMDELEQHGIVGPSEGGKPRRVLALQGDSEEQLSQDDLS